MPIICSDGTKIYLLYIGFCSEYSICNKNVHEKNESSWQRVRYYLEVGIEQDFLEIKWIYRS